MEFDLLFLGGILLFVIVAEVVGELLYDHVRKNKSGD